MPLFDMLANAQNGKALDQMASQFGLSRKQAQDAVEALMPAFSQGLKRNTSDPYDIGSFLSALSTGQHAKYFDNAANAMSDQGVEEGNGILGHLFGSKELSRAVAAQAAQSTGIAQQTLQQMLPALAAMIMGGLFRQSTAQVGAAGFDNQRNPLHQVVEQMMNQGFGRPQAQPDPTDNPLGRILEGMLGGGGQARRQTPQNPLGDNPLGRMFQEMLAGAQAQQASEPKAASDRPANPSGRARTPYDDLFGEMFETGAKARDDYQKNVESIFDQFVKGMGGRR